MQHLVTKRDIFASTLLESNLHKLKMRKQKTEMLFLQERAVGAIDFLPIMCYNTRVMVLKP